MKKITASFICLILCIGLFTGCNTPQSAEAYDLYQKMSQAMSDAESVDMDISSVVDIVSGDTTVNTTTTGNIKQIMKSATDFDMAMNLHISTMGTEMDTVGYYTGGMFYSDTAGIKTKMTMTFDDVMQQAGNTDILEFAENAIKDCKVTTVSGDKKLELTLDGKSVTNFTNEILANMQASYPELTAADLSIDDIICEAVVDSNNMMKSYKMICNMTIMVQGETLTMKMDTSTTVNSYNDVTIEFPSDLDTYVEASY